LLQYAAELIEESHEFLLKVRGQRSLVRTPRLVFRQVSSVSVQLFFIRAELR